MVLPATRHQVFADVIIRALHETPGLFDGVGGNRMAELAGDAATRIEQGLVRAGLAAWDESFDAGGAVAVLFDAVRAVPASAMRSRKRLLIGPDDILESEAFAICRAIISGLEKRGYRIEKAFLAAAPPSGMR